jgi:predicted O-methyltransferase YrrM
MSCVDLWEEQAERPDTAGAESYKGWAHDDHFRTLAMESERHFPGRITLIRESTFTAHRHFLDDSLDFVFIDADHSYDAVMQDIANWTPKVRKMGIIAGHDINWWTVAQAVRETGGAQTLPDNVWWRYRE